MKMYSLKWYSSLMTKKGRKKESAFLVEGRRAVSQIVDKHPELVREQLVLEGEAVINSELPFRFFDAKQLKSILSTETLVPYVAVVNSSSLLCDCVPNDVSGKVLFLEDVQDPGNVGTLIRSAVAFGFRTLIITTGCADPLSAKVVRSTGGAIAEVQIVKLSEPYQGIEYLKEIGFKVITADLNGANNIHLDFPNIIFALGNEGNGVSEGLKQLSDHIYTIPFESNKIESLNVAVAGSIGMASLYTGV